MLYTLGVDEALECWDTNQNGKLSGSKSLYDEFDIPTRPMVGRSGRRHSGLHSFTLTLALTQSYNKCTLIRYITTVFNTIE